MDLIKHHVMIEVHGTNMKFVKCAFTQQCDLLICIVVLIDASYTVKTNWVINRKNAYGEQPKNVEDRQEITINQTLCNELANLIKYKNHSVVLFGLIPKFIKVTGFGGATAVPHLMISNESM